MNDTKTLQKTAIPAGKPKALELMASRLHIDPVKLLGTLKETVFKKCTEEELMALVVVSNEYGLNPLVKEIFAFPAKGGGICPIVSIDGWNKMLLRQDSFDGIEFDFVEDDEGKPVTCTATIYVKSRSRPVKITEYFTECYRNTEPWNNMPHRMLRNRTLCQAARVAFGFAGVVDPDEAIDIIATAMPSEPLKAIKGPAPADNQPSAGQPSTPAPTHPVRTPQQELEGIIIEAGLTYDDFRAWAVEKQQFPNPDSLASFEEVPSGVATRLIRAVTGMVNGIKAVREGRA